MILIIQLAGLAHIGLGLGSVMIPKMLDWKSAFTNTPTLIKQMFWTYAGYILFINVFENLAKVHKNGLKPFL